MLKRTCGVGFTAATSFKSASAPAQSPPVCSASACANCSLARLSPSPSLLGPCACAVPAVVHRVPSEPSTRLETTSQRLTDLGCIPSASRSDRAALPQLSSVQLASALHQPLIF